jgi:SsrA-binding protein
MRHFNKDSRDYAFIDKLEAGLSLSGSDVKSLRTQTVQFANSKIDIIDGVPRIENLHIPVYKYSQGQIIDVSRSRPLLLKAKEIAKLQSYRHQKYALIPIAIFLSGKWFKVEIGIGKKIKKYEKREKIKAREFQRGKI